MPKYIPLVGDFDPEEIEQHRREWVEAEERRAEHARISRDAILRWEEKLLQQRAALKADADALKVAQRKAKAAVKAEYAKTLEGQLEAVKARHARAAAKPAREAAKTAALARLLGAESALKAFYEAGGATRDPLERVWRRVALEAALKDARREWRRYASHKAGGE